MATSRDDLNRLSLPKSSDECSRILTDLKILTRPPLRWAGSKRKSIKTLTRLVPEGTSHVIEPFAGSACFTLGVDFKTAVVGDLNDRLIEFYEYLKSDPEGVYESFAIIEPSRENYFEVRKRFNEAVPSIDRAAQFLFLNRYCFNGIFRVNLSGQFNVPWGGEKVGKPPSLEELVQASKRLKNVKVRTGDFQDIIEEEQEPGCLVYLDPPYARNEERVFREYHKNSFSTLDWDRLIETIENINQSGSHFILSYAGDGEVVERLAKWQIGFLDVTRNVGGFKSSRRKFREFLATNCEVPFD
jgi:DNA adenine methylase